SVDFFDLLSFGEHFDGLFASDIPPLLVAVGRLALFRNALLRFLTLLLLDARSSLKSSSLSWFSPSSLVYDDIRVIIFHDRIKILFCDAATVAIHFISTTSITIFLVSQINYILLDFSLSIKHFFLLQPHITGFLHHNFTL
ncbi:Topoisomerase 1-associated factor 1, partial [Frankliniella fusca]